MENKWAGGMINNCSASAVPDTDVRSVTRLLPPYKLILLNDDHHGMDFVVEVLMKIMRWPLERAMQSMMEAHQSGLTILMIGPLEVVELKFEQITSCHEGKKGPLGCVIEAT
jgi:ATP-dependent Clp protease adapter protein ClpS